MAGNFLQFFVYSSLLYAPPLLAPLKLAYPAIQPIYQYLCIIQLLRQFMQLSLIGQQPLLGAIFATATSQPATGMQDLASEGYQRLKVSISGYECQQCTGGLQVFYQDHPAQQPVEEGQVARAARSAHDAMPGRVRDLSAHSSLPGSA